MSIINKKTQKIDRQEMKAVLAVARGDAKADLLIKNIKLMDLINGGSTESAIVVVGGTIAGIGIEYSDALAERVVDGKGMTATPGFIDSHLHVESSMMHPFEFEKETLPRGTTSIVCDPHEIANVMGKKGVEWFLRCSEAADQNQFVQISSCVPALKGFETNAGELDIKAMKGLRDHSSVMGLGEVMNYPGVISGDDGVLDKIELFDGLSIDGHCPLLRGKDLNAYIAGGVKNCHETIRADEAIEKLQKGMFMMIREGTVAKNLEELGPVITEFNSMNCMLCTDDRNPYEIKNDGHIDSMVRHLIQENKLASHVAYRVATYSPARHFGLKRLGLIAPGMQADILLISDVEKVIINKVFVKGVPLDDLKLKERVSDKFNNSNPPIENTMDRRPLTDESFALNFTEGTYNVMEVIPGEIITKHLKVIHNGATFEDNDILKISVIERYGNEQAPSIGLVKGFGLQAGALASSVAHDCHNIVVTGTNDKDMAAAVNHLIKKGGGFCTAKDGKILFSLDLPIGGLMSMKSAPEIVKDQMQLHKTFKGMGVTLDAPFLQMAFLALPVIPTLKLSDKGLFDLEKFSFIGLKDE